MSENTVSEFLAENPRMMGVVFTMLLLLSQAGNSAAANMLTVSGP